VPDGESVRHSCSLEHVARRTSRVRAHLALTAVFAEGAAVACRTRDVSESGLFLDLDPSVVATVRPGAPVSLAVMDTVRGEAIELGGEVIRLVERTGAHAGGVAIRLIDPPESWRPLVLRTGAGRRPTSVPPAARRMRVLVVGDDARRRGAMALYVTSGWDVRFASDLRTVREALTGFKVDAIVAEHDLDDPRWPKLLEEVRVAQPMARRVVRAPLKGVVPPPAGSPEDLVHCVVDVDAGLDAFVAAITDA
jgi:hypothetical protein